jgi:hypothetical protein
VKKPVLTDVAWIDPETGKPTQYFSELIQNMSENGLNMPMAKTVPTNGQVVKFVSATGLWTPSTDAT